MSLLILIGLTLLLLALAASGTIGLLRRSGSSLPVASHSRMSDILPPAIGVALTLLPLLNGSRSAALPVPAGFAGSGGGLQLDPLSCLFLLLVFVVGSFAALSAGNATHGRAIRHLCLSAIMLAMLAGDVFLLAIGGTLAVLALERSTGRTRTGPVALLSMACLIGACTVLASLATPVGALLPDGGFMLLRDETAASGTGFGQTSLPLLLSGIAVVPLLGLWPCPGWHRRLCVSSPAWAPALASLLGLFLLLRLLLDLAGATLPVWWGFGLIALGLVSALRAGVASIAGRRLRAMIGNLLALQNGLLVTAVGLCLLAKADDLPVLAAAALDAVLLLAPTQLLAGLAVLRLAQAIEDEAGASLLARLGGLVQSMPFASLFAGMAASILCFLPPAGGFGGLWLLLQTALSASRPGGIPLPGLATVVAAIVLAAGLSGLGWLRLAAVVVLGRPRTPRGAAAQEIPRPLGRAIAGLLAPPLLIGLLPGVWLRLVMPVGGLLGIEAVDPPWSGLASPGGASSLDPLPLTALALLALAGCVWTGRHWSVGPDRREPAWEGGIAPPPPWLPFGDPLTQIAPATLMRTLLAIAGAARLPRPRSRLRTTLAALRGGSVDLSRLLHDRGALLAFMLLVVLLALFGWWRVA